MNPALRIIIFVIVMGTVSGAMLTGVNTFTLPLIEKNEELKLKLAVLDVLEIPYQKDNLLELFSKNVKKVEKDKDIFFEGLDGSIAFTFRGPGLWGMIEGIASINPDLKTIKSIKILHQEETPGLGARIADREYLAQFKSKEFIPKLNFVAEGKAAARNEVDAIAGATGSTTALEKLLNEALQKNINAFKGAGK